MNISLETFALVCFSIGVGVFLLVTQPTIKEVARFVGAIGGILYGLLILFRS